MIKFFTKADEKHPTGLIGLGLSKANLEKLQQGLTILVNGSDIDHPDLKILIFYGETEKQMLDSFKESGMSIGHSTIDLKSMRCLCKGFYKDPHCPVHR